MTAPGTRRAPFTERTVAIAFEGFVRASLRTHIRTTVIGRENLPTSGGFVIVSNHSSHLDAVVLMHLCGGRFGRFHLAAASDYFFGMGPRQPGGPKASKFGLILRSALNLEPMPRRREGGETADREEAIQRAFANLRATCRRGDVVVYFPEGSRSPDGTIRHFRSGIDELAAELSEPVIPVHIEGAHALWPKGKRWTRRGELTVTIGKPMHSSGGPGERPVNESLAARLESEIRRLGGLPTPIKEATMTTNQVEHMKWWGWGDENVSFTHTDKPELGPFIREQIEIDLDGRQAKPIDFDALDIAEPIVSDEFAAALGAVLRADQITSDPMERVVHTYGKSLRDLVRIRRGDLGRLPDVIVYPETEDEVSGIMTAALAHNAVVIPFGGGTNISESLEPPRGEQRTVLSVDMQKMDRVIEIDSVARTARVQAGVFGPHLEEQLNAKGWTLGHFPDSFTYSTLGGWIATRSSGMQSDKYGDIADITKGLRAVTPAGVLVTRSLPSKSTGPDVNQMMIGSEGRLGIITEATVQVHRQPEVRKILGYLFPNWETSLRCMAEIAESAATPSVTRVSDPNETKFSFATKKAGGLKGKFESVALKQFLTRVKHYELDDMCLSFIGYEGDERHVKLQRKLVGEIVSKHNGVCVGSSPGEMYDQKKFDTPYIRDHLLNYGGLADVSETSAPWSQLLPLYEGVNAAAKKAFAEIGVAGWIMSHLSHSYHSGACLYFTFAFREAGTSDALEQYDVVKNAIQQAFIDFGGTLSHHHGVGRAHSAWLEQDISPAGVSIVRALFDGVDPEHQLNPGKIVE